MKNIPERIPGWVPYVGAIVLVCIVIVIFIYVCFSYPVTTVMVVRHAEKANAPVGDPVLNAAGDARAKTLVHVAGDAGVSAIYASQYTRTQQTVQYLADHLGLSTNIVNAPDVTDLVDQIMADHGGEVVFVAGHSNTVPQIIEELGGDPVPPIPESEYDNLYIVTVYRSGQAEVLHLRYGEPS
jgi:broad specificity phosphatase PhoE